MKQLRVELALGPLAGARDPQFSDQIGDLGSVLLMKPRSSLSLERRSPAQQGADPRFHWKRDSISQQIHDLVD